MKPVDIRLPPGAEVANYIYAQMDLEDLTQDLVAVRLPNGYFVDAGWYPEHDPNGRYVVRVFLETWDRQALDKPFTTRETKEAVRAIENLAERFSRPQIMLSRAGHMEPVQVAVKPATY